MSLHCLSQKKLPRQILPDFLPQQNFPQFVPLAVLPAPLLPAVLLFELLLFLSVLQRPPLDPEQEEMKLPQTYLHCHFQQ